MKILTWGEKLGWPECPYFIRWCLNFWLFSIRIHHWLASDDGRAFHDHPWWFLTIVLRGSYTDVSPTGNDVLRPGSVRLRPSSHRHTVKVTKGGCWTLVLTGPETKNWGFYPNGKFRKRNKWFHMAGHHPCE